jgi:ribonuclease D
MKDYRLVTDNGALASLAEALLRSERFGVDTESDSFYRFKERVCLVQVTPEGGADYIIDPLQDLDMSLLAPAFANPDIEVIMHGADYDVVSMKRDFGYEIRGLFDTMLAAQITGIERFGLADLVRSRFDVELDKRFQRFDWGTRPLPSEALDYARLDSHYLPTLRHELWERAAGRKRQDALREEFALIEERSWNGRGDDPAGFYRIKGAGNLEESALRVLRCLYELRNEIAEELDRPPFKVFPATLLLELASSPDIHAGDIQKLGGGRGRMVRRYGRRLAGALRRGRQDRRPLPPRKSGRNGPRLLPEHEDRYTALKSWRNRYAKEQELQPALVVSNTVLKCVAAAGPRDEDELAAVNGLRKWQRYEYGELLLSVLRPVMDGEGEGKSTSRRRRSRRRRKRSGG